MNYLCRNDFNIERALNGQKVDIIFSQAAFEHFDNYDETIKIISKVVEKGAVAVVAIDLKTHSRWIRDKDPNNIYKYPGWLYGLFKFRGIPNRVRPYQYIEAFERHGWGGITIEPGNMMSDDMASLFKNNYNELFINDKNQMNYLSVWLCATKI